MWSTHGGHVSETKDKTDSIEDIGLFLSVEAGDCIYCKEPHPVISVLTGYEDKLLDLTPKLPYQIGRDTRKTRPRLGVSYVMLAARPSG